MSPTARPPLDRIELRPIGHVRTAHRRLEDTPIQTHRNPDEPGRLVSWSSTPPPSTGWRGSTTPT